MSRKEKEIKEAKELVFVILFAMLATAFAIGIWVGEETAIHNCYMVQENDDTYVLNFNGIEHLYLRGK